MRTSLLSILLTLLSLTSFSQEQFIEKPAQKLTQFSFRALTGGVMMIQATINDLKDTLNFILDTGSGGISLDSATCEEFNIPHSPSGRTINGIAGIRDVDFARNNTLNLPGLSVPNLDFYVNDYEVLTSVYGEKIDGIIGYSLFSRFIVKLNFDSLRVEIFKPGSIRYPPEGYLLQPMFTGLPILPLRIRDDRTIDANFYFDTGAGLCFLVSKEFKEDSNFLMKKRVPVSVQAEGLGGKKRMHITMIKEVKLGPYRFRRVPTHILDDEFNATSYPYVGGLIGNDILRRFNIILNYPKHEIHITPNRHFNEAFDYSYTGMSLYYIDGKIEIDDLIPESPAVKAGFKKGDVVLSVNNNFSGDINQYNNLLQSEGERVKVLVLRDKVPILISFKVGRIY